MEQHKNCMTCNKPLVNIKGNVSFPCPGCEKYPITRCFSCRQIAARYTCPSCGFTGPN